LNTALNRKVNPKLLLSWFVALQHREAALEAVEQVCCNQIEKKNGTFNDCKKNDPVYSLSPKVESFYFILHSRNGTAPANHC
jgi:hypothetical protein